jgi:hypothetical protein
MEESLQKKKRQKKSIFNYGTKIENSVPDWSF